MHVICQLVVKYDAIIVMEKLTDGFKRGRTKFEKQVYQKFEKMLIDKLNYYVDKSLIPMKKAVYFMPTSLRTSLRALISLVRKAVLFSMFVLILQAKLIPLPAL